MEKLIWRLAPVALALILAGCGDVSAGNHSGSGSASTDGGTSGSGGSLPPSTATTLSGVAVDGYLSKANACLDLNDNGVCDTGEPLTQTDDQGKYTLQAPSPDAANNHHVLIEVVSGITVDTDNPSAPVTTGYTLTAPIGFHKVISPISSLIHTWEQLYPGTSRSDLLEAVRQNMGFSKSLDLTADFAIVNATEEQITLHKVARLIPAIIHTNLETIQTAIRHPLSATEKQQAIALISSRLWFWMPSLIQDVNSFSSASQIMSTPIFDIGNIAGQLGAAGSPVKPLTLPLNSLASGWGTATYYSNPFNVASEWFFPEIYSFVPQPGSTTSQVNLLTMDYEWSPTTSTFVLANGDNRNSIKVLNNVSWITPTGSNSSLCALTPIASGSHLQCNWGSEWDESWSAIDLSAVNIDGYFRNLFRQGTIGTGGWHVAPDKVFSKGAIGYISFDKTTNDLYSLSGAHISIGDGSGSTFTSLDSAMQAASTNGLNHYQLGQGNFSISFDTVTGNQGNLTLYTQSFGQPSQLPLKGTWNRFTIGQVELLEFTIPDVYQNYRQQSSYLKDGWTQYQGEVIGFSHLMPGAMKLSLGALNQQALTDVKTYLVSLH